MTALDYILSRYQMTKYEKAPKERAVLNPNRSLGFLYVVRQREILMTDLGKTFLVKWCFHDVVFGHPYIGLHSLVVVSGFRPCSTGAVIVLRRCFLHSFLHTVTFNYCRLFKVRSFNARVTMRLL